MKKSLLERSSLFRALLSLFLLVAMVGNAWGEVVTATLDLSQNDLGSSLEVGDVQFSWNSSVSTGKTGSGIKSGGRLTVTIPNGAKLVKIAKTNTSQWSSTAAVNVYAGTSTSGTNITSLVYGTNEYIISSNNTGKSYYFANESSKDAWITTLSITYEIDNGSTSGSIVIDQSKITEFTTTYKQYTWSDSNVSGKIYAYKSGGGTTTNPYLMQFNSTPYCYNTNEVPGRITSVTITKGGGTNRNWNVYVSNSPITNDNYASATPLSSTSVTVGEDGHTFNVESGDYKYFYIIKESGSTQISEFVINYETGSSSTTEQYSYTLETVGRGTVVFKDASDNTIAPGQEVNKNTKITPTFTPETGFVFSKWEYQTSQGTYSEVSSTDFTITKNVLFRVTFIAAAPEFDVEAGTYTEEQTIHVENYNDNIHYFYTTDGNVPDETSSEYDNNTGITINETTTLKMIAVDENGNKSNVTTATYIINIPTPDKQSASFGYVVHAKVGSQFQGLTFSNNLDAEATYCSSDTDVATVDATTGKVAIVGAGTAIITYTVTGSDEVNTASQTYTIIVGE